MLPHIHFLYLQIGPIKIYTWGFFVALGFLAALVYVLKKYPQEKEIFIDLCLYSLLGAIIGARIFFLLFYGDVKMLGLKDFFKIWDGGMSSLGGIFGGALATYLYARYEEINFYEIAQKIAFILPLGLAIGRIGCFLINDHPGIKTWTHPLSVAYPDGPRFDLGLVLFLFDTFIFIYFLFLRNRGRKKHLFLENFLIIYGAGRFLLDFLRIGEPEIAGLAPSQYGGVVLIAAGICLLVFKKDRRQVTG
jgi:phosphatidylglycerol:prolipoprotein diacylglycerol transferase